MNKGWEKMAHKAIPEILKGTIKKKLNEGAKKATKVGDNETAKLCSRAVSATHDLAMIMTIGYATRSVADYDPDIPMVFIRDNECSLNSITSDVALGWPYRAEGYIRIILEAWSQIND
jgi:hypothetical protein